MAEQAVRVALLARAGNARDQLHRALIDLGAELVAEGDPAELNPVAVAAGSPNLVIISIEPAIESALDRFDGLLALPGVDVMYDDAEVTRELDGWDLNRWARHLAAKLLGRDVMPPPPEGAAVAQAASKSVPAPPVLAAPLQPETGVEMPMPSLGLDIDPAHLEDAIARIDAGQQAPPAEPAAKSEEFSLDIDVGGLEQMLGEDHGAGSHDAAVAGASDGLMLDMDFDAGPGGFSQFGGGDDVPAAGLDDDVAALAAQLDALSTNDWHQQPQDPEFARVSPQEETPAPAQQESDPRTTRREAVAAPKPDFDFSSLSLAPMEDAPPVPPAPQAPKAAAPAVAFGKMSLALEPMADEVEDSAAPSPAVSMQAAVAPTQTSPVAVMDATEIRGVTLILAGLGGPDAVRQLLKALPAQLPVPVLLYQHLEVGNHDRLVSQLAKVSAWPVYLAGAGMSAPPGQVAVMPQGIGPQADGEGVVFVPMATQRAMVEGLSSVESLVFVLSGADPDAVPAALALSARGGAAMAQEPAACFDPAAAQAMVAGGGKSGDAAAMAQQLASRWA